MTEPTADVASQVAETESTPITNGTTVNEATDVTMADSTEVPVPTEASHVDCVKEVLLTLRQPPSQTAPQPEAQPEVQSESQPEVQFEVQPGTQPTPTPAPVSAPTPTPAPAAPASSRNSPHPTGSQQAPTQPIPHGSPTRVYLNQHVTPHLLEAMKHLATNEPEKPLKFLSEFLAMKSAEIEG
ncbi:compass complex subunit [Stagonosporopsis vannaccii]|nr:compass complex subunit [Stagonosporopsis vannaccii]